ncbi:MAG: diguanylate cyclase [Christensenella sp.]|nr:diguanylate cyclase [Christensenella sp.]
MHQEETKGAFSHDLREQILSELPCGLCFARGDERLSCVFANTSFYRMFGYVDATAAERDGFVGVLDRADHATRKSVLGQIASLRGEQEVATALEARLCRCDGSEFWSMIRICRSRFDDETWVCAFMDISAQKRVEDELRVREEEYRIAVCQSDKIVIRYDIERKMAFLPPESAQLFQRETLMDVPECLETAGVINPDSMDAFHELCDQIASGCRSTGSAVLQLCLDRGESSFDWYRVVYSLIYREEGVPSQAVISLENVSEQHAREVAYRRWEQTYKSMPQNSTAYLEFDLTQNRLELQKGALLEKLPFACGESMQEVVRYFLERYVHPEDRERIRLFTAREHLLTEYFRGAHLEKLEYRHHYSEDRYGWVRLSVQMLPDPYSSNIRASLLLRDIDKQKCEEINLKVQLRTDTLTGALNRGAFVEAAEALFAASPGGQHALVMVDVDCFKKINDRFGHGYGDRVLIRTCDSLRSALRADDLVCRLGGDEFVLLLKNVLSHEALQAKINLLCEQIFRHISSEMSFSCSFGAALFPRDGVSFDELYSKADIALYAAKESGRNCAHIFKAGMGRQMELTETN